MTTPPPGDDRHGEDVPPPPPDQTLPPAYLPQQPPWYPPPPGYRPPGQYDYPPPVPPWRPPTRRISVGMTFLGIFIYFVLNLVVAFAAIATADSKGHTSLIAGAVVLVLIAFGGGGALLATKNAIVKGLGLGLMIGWALLSVVSVGFCTGLNPEMYT